MHLERVKNRNGVVTVLVRQSYREDGKVKKRTVANITHLPEEIQFSIARQLKGEVLVPSAQAFKVVSSRHHGHVEAVSAAMKKLEVSKLLGPGSSQQKKIVMAMIAARILDPASKLATASGWGATTLPECFGVKGATENELYGAMDWLLEQQPAIERRLARRHLEPCGLVLYDLTSSYVEGTKCPLATRGYSRDGKPQKLQVNYGILTDEAGRPVAARVYDGNTADPATVQDQLVKVKDEFGLDLVVFVGDRGMLAQTVIEDMRDRGGFEWITALKSGALRKLHAEGSLQMGLFDERNIFEFNSELYPDERLIACRNPALAARRSAKRLEMVDATKEELQKIQKMVESGRLRGEGKIGVRVGRVINKYKMAKHFLLEIEDEALRYRVDEDSVRKEAALDGVYVVRTSVAAEAIDRDDVVRNYKRLTRVERAFRCMKTDLDVRPIFHRTENRVRAHIFLCLLAEYVQWHMRDVWRELLFAEEVDTLEDRDPVAPAQPTDLASQKKATKQTQDGLPLLSFRGLLKKLSSIVRNTCQVDDGSTFETTTEPDTLQGRALKLIKSFT